MKSLFQIWRGGWAYLFTDDLISFYTFFTVVLSECAYLWAFCRASVAWPLTIILLGYIATIIISAVLKGCYEGERKERTVSIIYVIAMILWCVVGCFINFWPTIIMTAIPVAITFLWTVVRTFQDTVFLEDGFGILTLLISKLFQNKVRWIISQIIIVGGPFVVFTIFVANIAEISIVLKILIPVLYLMIAPFIAIFEDESATCNVFEIAYDITWDKEFEAARKRI